MGLGAAVVGSAALGLVGSGIQSSAASSASKQQSAADQAAIAEQQQMFGVAQNALNPYISAGDSATSTLQSLLSPGTAASTLSSLPGFKFQSQWGDLAATNQLAAQGLGGSSGALGTALSNYNNGLASTYYNNYVSQEQNLANMGEGAASSLAGTATSTGQSIANTTQAQGNATASGTLGSANATAGGLSNASNGLLLSSLLGSKSTGSSGIYSNISNLFGCGNANTGLSASQGQYFTTDALY